ncbi:MAG: MFS transporter [Candidatus Dormibacteria bacterium]
MAPAPPAPVAADGSPVSQPEADPRRWVALGVVLCASFMVLLDVSIVNVAIPRVQANLRATFAEIQFVLAGYQLAYAVMLITGGRLGDIFGRKRLFLIGVSGFTLASALCGLAQSPTQLVAARVVQGLMAGLMYPQILAVIQVSFPPRERAGAFGAFGGVIGIATICGPLVGGLLIQLDLFDGWRPIFLVNVPVGMATLAAASLLLRESRAPSRPSLDPAGVVLITAALFLLAFPLVEGREAGWPWWAYACLLASAPALVAFGVYIVARRRSGRSPLIDPGLFADRAFVVGLIISIVFISGIPAFFFTFTLFLQIGLGYSALHAGLTTIPFAVGSALASLASVRLVRVLGKRLLNIGAAILVVGMLAVVLTLAHQGTAIHGTDLIPALLVSGVGLGLVVAPLVNTILAGVRGANAGAASGVLTTAQQIGGAIGVALVGLIYFNLLGSHAGVVAQGLHPAISGQLQRAGVPAPAIARVATGFDTCFRDRSNAADPTATPASCRQSSAASAQVGSVVQSAATTGRAENFLWTIERSIGYDVAVWSLTFFLVFLLPRPAPGVLRRAHPAKAA